MSFSQLGRAKALWPDLGETNSATMETNIQGSVSTLSDGLVGRLANLGNVADSATVEVDHNFGVNLSELRVLIYSGTVATDLTRVVSGGSPDLDSITIAEKSGSEKLIIEITNSTGGAEDLFAFVVHGKGAEVLSDLSDIDFSTAPANGDILRYNGTSWVAEGFPASSGEINFIENNNAQLPLDRSAANDEQDWIDSGAGSTVSISTTGGEIPRNGIPGVDTALKFSFAAGTNDYSRVRFRVPAVDRNKKLKIEMAMLQVDSYVTNTARVELYHTNQTDWSSLVEVPLSSDISGDSQIADGLAQFLSTFDANQFEYYELRIVNDGATGGAITVNDLVVGPGKTVTGAVVTAWEDTSADWSFTNGITIVDGNLFIQTRRVGSNLQVLGRYDAGAGDTLTTANPQLSFPSGLTRDNSVITTNMILGNGNIQRSGYTEHVVLSSGSSTSVFLFFSAKNNGFVDPLNDITTSGELQFSAEVPIAEWSGSGVVNLIQEDNLTDVVDYTPPGLVTNWTASDTTGKWSRAGEYITIEAAAIFSAFSSFPSWSAANLLPSGLTINESKMINAFAELTGSISGNADKTPCGEWIAIISNATYSGTMQYDHGSNAFFFTLESGVVDASTPASWVANDSIMFRIRVPITEWQNQPSPLVGFAMADADSAGLVSTSDQNWSGKKSLDDGIVLTSAEVTISSGSVSAESSYLVIDTESAAASDDLDTINGAVAGMKLIITSTDDARNVVVKHNTGNIRLVGGSDFTLDTTLHNLTLMYNGTSWIEVSRSVVL